MASSSESYRPRNPADSVLFQVVRDHFETFRAQAASLRDADAIDDGLTEIGLHGADVARLEYVETPQHVHRRLLDEVLRIERSARSRGQAPVCPTLERRKAPLKQRFDGATIARLRPDQELNGRLIA